MSAIADKTCPACKRLHVLYLADADRPKPGAKYLFLCRAEGIAVRWLDEGEGWKPVGAKPAGAAIMQPMD